MAVRLTRGQAKRLGVELPRGREAVVAVGLPPSVNNLFASVNGRRIKSRAYKAWLEEVTPALARLAPPSHYPASLSYVVVGEDGLNLGRDLGNLEKPLSDALVAAGVIPDDCLRYVHGVSLLYRPGASGVARVEVSVRHAG